MNMNILKKLSLITVLSFIAVWTSFAKAEETNTTPTKITADKLECDYEERVVYLRGSVVVRDAKGILKSDNATIYFKKDDSEKKSAASTPDVGSFNRIVAVGNVRMSSSDKAIVVISDKAVWSKKDNNIVLTGGPPMVKQGPSYIKAKRIIYDLTTQKCDFKPDPIVVFQVPENEKAKFLE